MTTIRYLTALAALAATTPACSADDFEDMIARCQNAKTIVVGRVTKVHSCTHPRGVPGVGTIATATIRVERYLKGASDAKSIEVELRCESSLELTPDDEDVIWFCREKQNNGRYLVKDWKWGTSSGRHIEGVLRLLDRKTRTAGMPEAKPGEHPISVVLGVDDGSGKALTAARLSTFGNLRLLVQFENHMSGMRSVMPCLYGSDIRWRYPYYDLEVVDADGKAVPRGAVAACRSVGSFSKWDIIPLAKGEVFRGELPIQGYDRLLPGKYRVRVRYTAKQNATITVRPQAQPSPDALTALKTVWEGSVESNWIDVEVGAARADPKP